MKYIIKSLIILLLLISSIPAFAENKSFVSLSDNSVNFGYVPQMSQFARTVTIKANTDFPIAIGKINTYCDCIETKMDKTILQPGDSINLELILNTKKLKGKLYKITHIYDENKIRLAKIAVTASIYDSSAIFKTISIEPTYINFSQFGDKGMEKINFTIHNITDETVPLELLYADTGFFDLSFPLYVDPNSKTTGVVELTANGKNSEFLESFTFEYIDANSQKFRFSVPVKRKIFK